MVDCVMIDPNYDGRVFNVALSDVPEKKTDTVAVKIMDMLGEDVLVTRRAGYPDLRVSSCPDPAIALAGGPA
jgi:hypothetical protein